MASCKLSFEEVGETENVAECIPPDQFSNAVEIWINKPHTVNRRLIGAKLLLSQDVTVDGNEDVQRFFSQRIDTLKECKDIELLQKQLETLLCELKEPLGVGNDEEIAEKNSKHFTFTVIVRDLVPKQIDRFHTARELILKAETCITFFPLYHIDEHAQYQHIDNTLAYSVVNDLHKLSVFASTTDEEPPCNALGVSKEWLLNILLPKLFNWVQTPNLNTDISSLKLLPVDEYSLKYQQLKAKYGPKLVESWTENTDPRKFVYEDIAIAAYLLLLWQSEMKEKQKFVDLGCGNGLLVYILSQEGHVGLGLDIRKRKIWDSYGPITNLKEMAITPSDDHLFPDYDWLIGNHSDELTPWIPVIAARSSFGCKYFVLPCCQWDFTCKFSGAQKVSEKKDGSSQYRKYLNYIMEIGKVCGFQVEEDTLRIPSTKRTCFIGRQRTYPESYEKQIDEKRTSFISERSKKQKQENQEKPATSPSSGNEVDHSEKWVHNFSARQSDDAVSNNCLNVSQDIKTKIVGTVFEALLSQKNAKKLKCEDGSEYNMGGSINLGDVISLFDKATLAQLKNECGGLQTLLRNHHQIFHVQGGAVRLRDWTKQEEHQLHQQAKKKRKGQQVDSKGKEKTKLCYFHEHHPHGCPLESGKCRFAHGNSELKPSETPS